MDENRYTNDYYTNRNQMNQGQVNQNQNSSSGTQGTNYYQTSSTNFQQSQMNHQQTKPVKQKKQYQNGHSAEEPDIQAHAAPGDAAAVDLRHGQRDAENKAHAEGDCHRAHRHYRAAPNEGQRVHYHLQG